MDFAISYLANSGTLSKPVSLDEFRKIDFATLSPIRQPPAHRKQMHTPGFFWFSTLNQHIYYNSYLERQFLLSLDFEGDCALVLEQPFVLKFDERSHIPDFLTVDSAGMVTVIDVKRAATLSKPEISSSLEATNAAITSVGWTYQVSVEHPSSQHMENLNWFGGYRRVPPNLDAVTRPALAALSEHPLELAVLLELSDQPLMLRAALFHLVWKGVLLTDFTRPLTDRMVLRLSRR